MSKKFSYFIAPTLFLIMLLLNDVFAKYNFNTKQVQVIALAIWIILWWATDAVPNAITALLPLILLPIFGVTSLLEASKFYSNPVIFLFMGGFFIALAMEKHKLHIRIALKLLTITGMSVNGIILGFMISTAFLSMWISNTAAVLMMLPIAISIVQLLEKNKDPNSDEKEYKNFRVMLMLSLAYSSSFGGIATLIGTPPNIIYTGFLKEFTGLEISFIKWMLVAMPFSIIMLAILFFLFTKVLFKSRLQNVERSKAIITDEIAKIGKMTKPEKIVSVIFFLIALSWVFKSQLNEYVFHSKLLNDTNISIIGGVLMFITPISYERSNFILSWEDTRKLPWGILLLFGGGLCLANALEVTKVIEMLINEIPLHTISFIILLIIFIVATLYTTEAMSNVTAALIYLPIAFAIVKKININPFYLTIPITIAASCAFMFPIGTPPNAISFSSGMIEIKDMVKAGICLNIISLIVILILTYTLVPLLFSSLK